MLAPRVLTDSGTELETTTTADDDLARRDGFSRLRPRTADLAAG